MNLQLSMGRVLLRGIFVVGNADSFGSLLDNANCSDTMRSDRISLKRYSLGFRMCLTLNSRISRLDSKVRFLDLSRIHRVKWIVMKKSFCVITLSQTSRWGQTQTFEWTEWFLDCDRTFKDVKFVFFPEYVQMRSLLWISTLNWDLRIILEVDSKILILGRDVR
jgi:hypothetical protein